MVNKAGDSLRYLTMQEESRKARDKSELEDEVKGKRIWRVGGIGIWTYSLDAAEEAVKREVWSKWARKHDRDKWLEVSRKRTEFYNRGGSPTFPAELTGRVQRRQAALHVEIGRGRRTVIPARRVADRQGRRWADPVCRSNVARGRSPSGKSESLAMSRDTSSS